MLLFHHSAWGSWPDIRYWLLMLQKQGDIAVLENLCKQHNSSQLYEVAINSKLQVAHMQGVYQVACLMQNAKWDYIIISCLVEPPSMKDTHSVHIVGSMSSSRRFQNVLLQWGQLLLGHHEVSFMRGCPFSQSGRFHSNSHKIRILAFCILHSQKIQRSHIPIPQSSRLIRYRYSALQDGWQLRELRLKCCYSIEQHS